MAWVLFVGAAGQGFASVINTVSELAHQRQKPGTYTYDARGNVLTETNPLSKTWTYTYSASNDLLTAEDPLDNLTVYDYDANGNLETVTDPLENVVLTCSYDGYGQLTEAENATGETVNLSYNSHGDIDEISLPGQDAITRDYDLLGHCVLVTDSAGEDWEAAYDEWGRAISSTKPDSAITLLTYDLESNLIAIEDALNRVSNISYDDAGRVSSCEDASGKSKTWTRNENGWTTRVDYTGEDFEEFAYSPRGEIASHTVFGSTQEWSHNANGDLTAWTDGNENTTNYVYDDAGRLTTVDYPSGTDTTYSYDYADRFIQMVDSIGTSTWTYDAAGQITQLVTPQGTNSFSYDDAGRRISKTASSIGTFEYGFDADGLLESITNPYSEVTEISYDTAGRKSRVDYHNGTYSLFTYDACSRIESVTHHASNNSVLFSDSVERDLAGNVVSRTTNGVETEYTYDDVDRLLSETRTGLSHSFEYDVSGRITYATYGGNSYRYDYADGLLYVIGNDEIAYDDALRLVSREYGASTHNFTYDFEGRMTSAGPSGSLQTFSYNGNGARVSAGNTPLRRVGVAPDSGLIAEGSTVFTGLISRRASSTSTFQHLDIFGSVALTTNSSGSVVSTNSFSWFGQQTSGSPGVLGFGASSGSEGDPVSGINFQGVILWHPFDLCLYQVGTTQVQGQASSSSPGGGMQILEAGAIALQGYRSPEAVAEDRDDPEWIPNHAGLMSERGAYSGGEDFLPSLLRTLGTMVFQHPAIDFLPIKFPIALGVIGERAIKIPKALNVAGDFAKRLFSSNEKGRWAEDVVEKILLKKGRTFEKGVLIPTPLGGRRPDFIVKTKSGKSYHIEVKFENARYSLLQRLKDAFLRREGTRTILMRVWR